MTPRRPDPPPLRTNDRRVFGIGTVTWALLLVVCLPFAGYLHSHGHLWWLWTCVVGLALGLLGVHTIHRRDRRRR